MAEIQVKEDLRIIKTRENLMHALLDLMQDKSLKDITVRDICNKARCSRKRFIRPSAQPCLRSHENGV